MKKTIILVAFFSIISVANAAINLDIYESDGLTAFDGHNITVGTSLKLIIISDANDFWAGGLFLHGNNRNFGILSGIGQDPEYRDYSGSHGIDAGLEATVTRWEDSAIEGFDLISDVNCVPGNWFEIDYTALAPGDPNIGFYDYGLSWDDPNSFLTFHQVPAADFNIDGMVNLSDFSLLASCWQANDCTDPNGCKKADLDTDGIVNLNDLLIFTDYWLWTEEEPVSQPDPIEPGQVDPSPDPNLIYQLVDANGLDEITIGVGQTVTLYVDMITLDTNRVWAFQIEADISDPNLGMIDNTAYDPNNPPGPGTARILAGPDRWTLFDSWGLGWQQQEGIYLTGISGGGAFQDGHLASFEFTCQGTGDVELNLINWDTLSIAGDRLYPTLKGILIHQNDPNVQMVLESTMLTSQEQFVPSSDSEISLADPISTESITPSASTEDLVKFLEELWLTDQSIRETYSDEDWQEFIDSVKQSD